MKRSNWLRMVSVFLAAAILYTSVGSAVQEEETAAKTQEDPFAAMVELVEEAPAMAGSEGETGKAMKADGAEEYEQRVQEKYKERSKTDRYIVKYKSDIGESLFEKSLGRAVQSTRAMENTSAVKKPKSGETEGFKLIVLEEPKEPAEFARQLRALGLEDTIEYIQPDFQLFPDALEQDSDESGSGESDAEDSTPAGETQEAAEQEVSEGPTEKDEPKTEPEQETEPEGESAPVEDGEPAEEPEPKEEVSPESENESEAPLDPEEEQEEANVEEEVAPGPVIVAVIDTGADMSHEMLTEYAWSEGSGEEELHGWNFVEQNEEIYDGDNPLAYAHGTHISGIIAQAAANREIALELMNLKVFENGAAYTSDVIAAIQYAEEKGAKIINCSFGGTQYNRALYEAIASSEALFVCAAGNNRMDLGETPVYPACFDLGNILSVASVNADGGFSYFSNYSTELVDIAALGRDVLSALPENRSDTYSGTSMAAAGATGAAAVVLNAAGDLNAAALKDRLLNSADKLSNLENKVQSGRRLNLDNAMANQSGGNLTVAPEDDFDVHGYTSTAEEMQLFSSATPSKIAAGAQHSLILMNDGSVWAFGNGYNGSLGDGNTSPHVVPYTNPVRVIGLPSDVLYIYAGGYHNLAVTYSGHVYTWGDNTFGQLGRSSTGNAVAMQVAGLSDIIQGGAGESHSMATYFYNDFYEMTTSTYTYFWGDNSQGQLGMGSSSTVTYPQSYITTAANTRLYGTGGYAGKDFTIITAITQPNAYPALYYGSGNNAKGQLCTATTTSAAKFTKSNATSVRAAGGQHAGYIKNVVDVAYGDVYVWGSNSHGQVGGAAGGYKTTAYLLYKANSFSEAASGLYMGENHTIIQISGGSLLGYGRNDLKQLAFGDLKVTSVAAGYNHNLAIASGKVWVWGANTNKQIANTTTTAYDPVEVKPGEPVVLSLSTNIAQTVLEYGEISGEITGTAAGEPVNLTAAALDAQAVNTSIAQASVEIQNNKAMLKVAGQRAGETQIEITATANGVSGTLTVPIEVLENADANLVVNADIPNSMIKDQCASAEITLTVDGTAMDLTEAGTVVTAESSAPLIVGAAVATSNGKVMLTVTGYAAGEATVNISVTFRGKTRSIGVPVTVALPELSWSGAEVRYQFRRSAYAEDAGLSYDLQAAHFANYGATRPWAYVNDTATDPISSPSLLLLADFAQLCTQKGEWVALKIKVPAAGRYKAELSAYSRSYAGIMDIYTVPLSAVSATDAASIAGLLTPANLRASANCWKSTSAGTVESYALEDMQFAAAGEYLLILRANAASPGSHAILYPQELKLDGTVELPLSGAEVRYQFRRSAYAEDAGLSFDLKAAHFASYGATRPWAYVNDTATDPVSSPSLLLLADFAQLCTRKGEWVALKIKIPAAGRYRAELSAYSRNYAGIMDIYTVPLSAVSATDAAGIADLLTPANLRASVNCWKSASAGTVESYALEDMQFAAAGEYLLILRANAASPGSYAILYPQQLTLDGEDPVGAPHLIYTEADLRKVGTEEEGKGNWALNAKYKLMNDLTLTGGWIPVNAFSGVFDGGGHTISGLTVSPNASLRGMFTAVNAGGVVKNLILTDVEVTGKAVNNNAETGAVAGVVNGGTIENCYVSGVVTSITGEQSAARYVGGIAGKVQSNGVIKSCGSSAAVSSPDGYAGGIAGDVSGGGIIENCYFTGTVGNGHQFTGGITGLTASFGGPATISNCYVSGTVNGSLSESSGGISGCIYNGAAIENCIVFSEQLNAAGRIFGELNDGEIAAVNNYAWSETLIGEGVIYSDDPTGKDGKDFINIQLIDGSPWEDASFDFENIWVWADWKMPQLKWMASLEIPSNDWPEFFTPPSGDGTYASPFMIYTEADLRKVGTEEGAGKWTPSAYYGLMNDIALKQDEWTPIGTSFSPFTGNFNGYGHTITGLSADNNNNYQGLFGYIDGGAVRNLTLLDVDINGGHYVGGIVGMLKGTSSIIENCYVSGSVGRGTGYEYSGSNGGIAGLVYYGFIENCGSSVDVSDGGDAGGIVGLCNRGIVRNCYATGSVSGWPEDGDVEYGSHAGGILGLTIGGTVKSCYATGNVTNANAAGGVIGYIRYGQDDPSQTAWIQDCIALSDQISATDYSGRIVGYDKQNSATLGGNSAWSGTRVDGSTCSSTNAASWDGKDISTAQILDQSLWTTAAFNFNNTWNWGYGNLPQLQWAADLDMAFPSWPGYIINLELAPLIELGETVSGELNSQNDSNILKFTMPYGDSIKIETTGGITVELYDRTDQRVLQNDEAMYALEGDKQYYIKVGGSTGAYTLKLVEMEQDFDIYRFDVEMNTYKNGILTMCNDYANRGTSFSQISQEIYNKYEAAIDMDLSLHELPENLKSKPSADADYDEKIIEYYATKATEFKVLRQNYLSIIDEYWDEWLYGSSASANESTLNETEAADPALEKQASKQVASNTDTQEIQIEEITPLAGFTAPLGLIPGAEEEEDEDEEAEEPNEEMQPRALAAAAATDPSLTISYNATSFQITANFKNFGPWGNALSICNFNNAVTTFEFPYKDNMRRPSGINAPITIPYTPGDFYIIGIHWSTDGKSYGGVNSRYWRVYQPGVQGETESETNGKIKATIERSDKTASTANFNRWLTNMNTAYNKMAELTGNIPHNGAVLEQRTSRELMNAEFIEDGSNQSIIIIGLSGNPARIFRPVYRSLMKRLSNNDWGRTNLHEMGHEFDVGKNEWEFDPEVLAELKVAYVLDKTGGKIYDEYSYDNRYYTGSDYIKFFKTDKNLSFDYYLAHGEYDPLGWGMTAVMLDIKNKIGWDAFKKAFAYMGKQLTPAEIIYINGRNVPAEIGKFNLFITKLNENCSIDILSDTSLLLNKTKVRQAIESKYGGKIEYYTPGMNTGNPNAGYATIYMPANRPAVRRFTPTESGSYRFFTTKYAKTGLLMETTIEVFNDENLTNRRAVSSTSNLTVSGLVQNQTYYIRVSRNGTGPLMADLKIVKPTVNMTPPNATTRDTRLGAGESAIYSYTTGADGGLRISAEPHSGGTPAAEINSVIEIYEDERLTKRREVSGYVTGKYPELSVNLSSNKTYYIVYTGYLGRAARAKIKVEAQPNQYNPNNPHVVIYDAPQGTQYGTNRYSDYNYTVTDFTNWLNLTGGDVNFIVQLREVTLDKATGNAGDGYYNLTQTIASSNITEKQNVICERMKYIVGLIIQAANNTDTSPSVFISSPLYSGALLDLDKNDNNLNAFRPVYKNMTENIYNQVEGYVEQKTGTTDILAGICFGGEGPWDKNSQNQIMGDTASFIRGKGKKILSVPYTQGSRDLLEQIAGRVNYGMVDTLLIQPGYFYKEIGNRGDLEFNACMNELKDSVTNQKIYANGGVYAQNYTRQVKIGVTIEYDNSLITGRIYYNNAVETKSTPQQKAARLITTFEKYYSFFKARETPLGIYSGGPNEQNYSNITSTNTRKHSNKNHLTIVTNGDGKPYNEFYAALNINGGVAYSRNLIYDIDKAMIQNDWTNILSFLNNLAGKNYNPN